MARVTINLSDDLHCILNEIQRRERYRSPSEVVVSFLRHWAISQQEHAITGPWAALLPHERDELDKGLCALVQSGKGKKGSWLKAVIYDTIKEALGADAKSPTVDQVMRLLPKTASAAVRQEPSSFAEKGSSSKSNGSAAR